jgi:uncharacterized repeat protein (TIGR01451 family)
MNTDLRGIIGRCLRLFDGMVSTRMLFGPCRFSAYVIVVSLNLLGQAQTVQRNLTSSVTVFPAQVKPGELSTFIVTISNPTNLNATNVRASSIIPEYVQNFLAWQAGGSCPNLLNNCFPAVRITWEIGVLEAGRTRVFSIPVQIIDGGGRPPDGTAVQFNVSIDSAFGNSSATGVLLVTSGPFTLGVVPERS